MTGISTCLYDDRFNAAQWLLYVLSKLKIRYKTPITYYGLREYVVRGIDTAHRQAI